jgi:hypothetical protein
VDRHQVKIFDTFLYSGQGTEEDLLECRLRELDGLVDKHVIVEGGRTFQGERKELSWVSLGDRFKPWQGRTEYVPHAPSTTEPGKEPGDAWAREHSSRQAVRHALRAAGAHEGDIILHGDVDEIPSREAIISLREHADEITPCKLQLRFFMFAVDWEVPWRWHAPSVMRYGQLDNFTHLREIGWPDWPHVQPAGWHLSWLGGEAAARQKVRSFSHAEAIPETDAGLDAGKYWRHGVWWPGSGRPNETQFLPAEVDDSWPKWIQDSWDARLQRPKPEGPAPHVWFRPREEGLC